MVNRSLALPVRISQALGEAAEELEGFGDAGLVEVEFEGVFDGGFFIMAVPGAAAYSSHVCSSFSQGFTLGYYRSPFQG